MKARWALVALAAVLGLGAGLAWICRDRTRDRVYRMGFDHSPPGQMVGPDGRPRGMMIDVIREAARRRGIRLEWVQAPEGPDHALGSGKVHLWPIQADLA
ncbi:MAG: hypothetical protein HY822_25100, partial [Acidobacteria bacterium]|nr:hypothetical protein [Acidobacteriota bacterium]